MKRKSYICQNLTNMLFADKIRNLRESKQLPQRELAEALSIDVPMYSRIERGERPAKREQVSILARVLGEDEDALIRLWLADRMYKVIADEEDGDEAVNVLQEQMAEYRRRGNGKE